jgi:hypothetical protein
MMLLVWYLDRLRVLDRIKVAQAARLEHRLTGE